MDAMVDSTVIAREILIAASPETIWSLLTDPHEAIRWMGRTASFDLRPGGAYRVEVIPGHVAAGAFVEIAPLRRLVFTWGWEGEGASVPPGSTTVEFELVPRGEATLLRFSHRDLPDAAAVASHTHGWEHYLERLTGVAAGNDPGVDPWIAGPMK
jgi:uncharacterized protein YndB with AHSA1/START domain